jgi:CheY-like chemotaxis protein
MNILLVEDDVVDRKAIRRALRDNAIDATLVEVVNGAEALELLHEDEAHSALPKPLMILLDINMPQMGGHEFLRKLRHEETKPEIRDAVVFVLTTSKAEEDRKVAYEHHVAGYIV